MKLAKTLDWELDHILPTSALKWTDLPQSNSDKFLLVTNLPTTNPDAPSYYHPLISYLDSEDFGVDICKDDELKIGVTITPEKGEAVTYTKKEFEALNRSVKEFIEFQLYKKSNR
jgi:hypothetical protein